MSIKTLVSRIIVGAALTALVPIRAADYSLTVNTGVVGHFVYPTMFGTNIVYNAVDVSQWPTFLSTFDALGMTTLRYPGGGVAEADFDFHDSNGPADDCITLTMFLQAVAAHDITPLLVVPTKRYSTDYGTTGAQYVKDFVKAVNVDHGIAGGEQFGTGQTVQIWELGNEYYTSGAPLTPTLYGKIADKFASAMKTIDGSIIPVVQFERNDLAAAQTIANQLTSGAVGACLTHTYPTTLAGINGITSQIVNGSNIFALEPMVTEWNMGSDSAEPGLVLANDLPKLFRALVNAGVTITTQWPMMWHNNNVKTLLAENTGTLRPPGQVFQWLSQAAQNRRAVDTGTSDTAIDCVAFKDGAAGKLSILVLCGASRANAQVAITVNGFGTTWTVSSVKRYAAAGGFGTETSNTPAILRGITPAKSGNVLTITTNKYSLQEVIRIDLTQ